MTFTLHHGCGLEGLRALPDRSVVHVITTTRARERIAGVREQRELFA